MNKVAQIKITLANIRPPIWRRVLIDVTSTLADLHEIIQYTMGWEGYHLHAFDVAGMRYDPDPKAAAELLGYWQEKPQDEHDCTIEQLLRCGTGAFTYEYDFGDDWVHKIKIEKVLDPVPGQRYPTCIKGKRACPPEDCGGPWGYASMLETLQGPDSQEKKELCDWLDADDFDPEYFDLEESNKGLEFIQPGAVDARLPVDF